MVKSEVEYLGDLHCRLTHGPSGQQFMTDAPTDNQGKGDYFSPTDLCVASLASCVTTIMGIIAKSRGIEIEGLKVVAFKEMMNKPYRRIKKIIVDFDFPKELTEKEFRLVAAAVDKCPVTKSLNPEIEIERTFKFAGKPIDYEY